MAPSVLDDDDAKLVPPEPPFAWTCPYCERATTISKSDFRIQRHDLTGIENKQGMKSFVSYFIVCPNPDCKELSFHGEMYTATFEQGHGWSMGEFERHWQLIPPSRARVFPAYVPKAILTDYYEACQIQDLSPKAAATLARRCLQGMIRDFWGIQKARLADEIKELEQRIDPLTQKAIDAVRTIGNIGAHMEKDVNLVIDVDPDEAALLISLIETLITEWYVARHEREVKMKQIVDLANKKQESKSK